MALDEFEIIATDADGTSRVWKRSRLAPCKVIAESAVQKLGYQKAQVFNVFGGNRSESLYDFPKAV
jgi:hypothetical protein